MFDGVSPLSKHCISTKLKGGFPCMHKNDGRVSISIYVIFISHPADLKPFNVAHEDDAVMHEVT